jgi:hypothetical protein
VSKFNVYFGTVCGDTLEVFVNGVKTGSYGFDDLKNADSTDIIFDDIKKKLNPDDEGMKDIRRQFKEGAERMVKGSKEILDMVEEAMKRKGNWPGVRVATKNNEYIDFYVNGDLIYSHKVENNFEMKDFIKLLEDRGFDEKAIATITYKISRATFELSTGTGTITDLINKKKDEDAQKET